MNTFAKPNVGSVITVTTRRRNHVIGRGEFDDTTYDKVRVIKPFDWTKPDAFCIPAENEPYINVRTLALDSVIALEIHEGSAAVTTDGTKFVAVAGSKGQVYQVTVKNGHGVECDCLGYSYRKQCKHLQIASEEA